MKLLSLVIPVFNEEQSLEILYKQINSMLNKQLSDQFKAELIFINDGSTDNTLNRLKKLQARDPRIKIISFRRNLGKASALQQGFKIAKGKSVITLDGDLQDGPENIPMLLEKLNEGYDLVVGWKKKRFDPLGKTIPSKTFNFVVGRFSKIPLHDFNSGLKIMRSEVAKELNLYGELHRFIPVLAANKGYKVAEIPVNHHPRLYGQSKYGWKRLFKGFLDFLTIMFLHRFGQRPLHLFGSIGSISILIGVVFGVYLSYLHFVGIKIGDRPLLILSVLLIITGLQLLSFGLIAEMFVRNSNSKERIPIDYEK